MYSYCAYYHRFLLLAENGIGGIGNGFSGKGLYGLYYNMVV